MRGRTEEHVIAAAETVADREDCGESERARVFDRPSDSFL